MNGHLAVADSLQDDADQWREKYQTETGGMGRYMRVLPRVPQHMKFCTIGRGMATGTIHESQLEGKNNLQPGSNGSTSKVVGGQLSSPKHKPKFNIGTIRGWFKEIDVDRTGKVTRRKLLNALTQHKEMQALFLQHVDHEFENSADLQDDKDKGGKGRSKRESLKDKRLAEIRRIGAIMQDIDTDNSGTMEWEEFVEFFRRCDHIVEYETRWALNDDAAKDDGMLDVAEQVQKRMTLTAAGISAEQIDRALEEDQHRRSKRFSSKEHVDRLISRTSSSKEHADRLKSRATTEN
jgi:Ca2+-binding EF-hand superfamily protein